MVTRLLAQWSSGNPAAIDELTPYVYRELHSIARSCLNRRTINQTLQPTAPINEAYLRLIGRPRPVHQEGSSHFPGIAARIMRQVLVDHARARGAARRGGCAAPITLEEAAALLQGSVPEILALDQALNALARLDERKVKVVELRYFAGMSREEIAAFLGLTIATVKRDLRPGEAWLRTHLSSVAGHGSQ